MSLVVCDFSRTLHVLYMCIPTVLCPLAFSCIPANPLWFVSSLSVVSPPVSSQAVVETVAPTGPYT